MDSKQIVKKSECLIQDILEESTRLRPLLLLLFDDHETNHKQISFLGHFINRLTMKNTPEKVILLLLGTNQIQFDKFANLKNKLRVEVITEDDIVDSIETTDLGQAFYHKLKSSESHVLIINSINPLFTIFDDDNQLYKWIAQLQDVFQKVIITYHLDALLGDDSETQRNRVDSLANASIDFRLNYMGSKDPMICTIVDDTTHCFVITKKKHPRTHFQIDQKHEHFRIIDGIIEFLNEDAIQKRNDPNNQTRNKSAEPQSSFRLTLTEEELKAKDNLVLPYIKKQSNEMAKKEPDTGNESSIIYTYDKFDDFDDEDPDDDLDF